jgi:kinesin family protein 18/19
MVAVRLRPLSQKELENNEMDIVRIMDQKVVVLLDPADLLNDKNPLGRNRTKEKHYAFDYAFDKETGQGEIFTKTTKHLCDGVINGYNATVFAYGSTGAGKTYTMLGTEEHPGNMFLTLKEIFVQIQKYTRDRNYNIRVSFLEIYNEQIRDLIMVSQDTLDLREDPIKGVTVAGLSEVEVDTPEEILDLLIFGNRNRT